MACSKIDKSKFEIEVACEENGYLVDELRKNNIKVHRLDISNSLSVKSFISTYQLLKKVSPDIIHTHGGTAGFYGRLASIINYRGVVVHTYHGIHYLNFDKNFLGRLYKSIDKFLLRFTDCTICVAQKDFEIGLKAGIVKKENSIVIHNGVDVEKFSSQEKILILRSILKMKMNQCYWFGRSSSLSKRYEYLIKASKECEKFRMLSLYIGDGNLSSLESLAKMEYIILILLGDQKDPELFGSDRYLCLPSLWEGLPLLS